MGGKNVEVKEVVKINPDFTVEADGVKLFFTEEESKILDEQAKKKGIKTEELIRNIINQGLAKAADIIIREAKKKSGA
jgi:hypothetical protein